MMMMMLIASILHSDFVHWDDKTDRRFLYVYRTYIRCKMTQSGVEICLIYDFILLVEIYLRNAQWEEEEEGDVQFNMYLSLFDNLSLLHNRSIHRLHGWSNLIDRQETYLSKYVNNVDGIIEYKKERK